MSDQERYVPAAGRRVLTRLYDPVLALTTRERRFRALLLDQVLRDLPAEATVVDVGCGTGTFAIALAGARPDLCVIGIDGDTDILALAERKPGARAVTWRHGLAGRLPAEDTSAHTIVMSLLLHHLDPDGKRQALAETVRVLRPGGHLQIADWGRPHDLLMRGAFLLLQTLDGFENTRDHAAGRLPGLVQDAGLKDVTTYARLRTAWGSLDLIGATRR
ncbi:MAG: class I SAM-dependent methyltransferase [Solirubrobacterales bacterium]